MRIALTADLRNASYADLLPPGAPRHSMTPAQQPVSRTVSVEQERHVRALVDRVLLERTPRKARRLTVSSLATVLGSSVALVACRGDMWITLADSGLEAPLPAPSDPIWFGVQRLLRHDAGARDLWFAGDIAWTVIAVGRLAGTAAEDTGALLIQGDWRTSIGTLEQAGRDIARRVQRRAASRRRLSSQLHRFTRALAKAGTIQEVGAVVLQHVVKAVPSRFAAFAVPTEDGVLQIVATHGYPVELVRDVRIAPGDGVIGSVFDRRSALHVRDVTRNLGLQRRRPRYRTNSFLALPVLSGAAVDGVVCITDRLDDQPFDRDDLGLLRALLAPAGLAMAAARATEQAHLFARAATIDPVSGLFNRRYFHARVEEELERSVRQQTSVALLMIDMDDFKQINDQYGHPAGDLVIRQVSDIIRRSVRLFDICTRFGGEEFAVLMPAAEREHALRVAERIRQQIGRYRPVGAGLDAVSVTVSIGLAVAASRSSQELIDAADRALYRAKRGGKNRVEQNLPQNSSPSKQNSPSSQIMGHGE